MKQSNFEGAQEVIGHALHFMGLSSENPKEQEVIDTIDNILGLAHNGYTLIPWPDSQEFMEEDWFEEEAVLANEEKFGSSAYFIPIKYIIN